MDALPARALLLARPAGRPRGRARARRLITDVAGQPLRVGGPASLVEPAPRRGLALAVAASLACHAAALGLLSASDPAPGSREQPIPLVLLRVSPEPEPGAAESPRPRPRAAAPAPPEPVTRPAPPERATRPPPPPAVVAAALPALAPPPEPAPAEPPVVAAAPPEAPIAPPQAAMAPAEAPMPPAEPTLAALEAPIAPPRATRPPGPGSSAAEARAAGAEAPGFDLRGGYQRRPRYPRTARLRGAEGTTLLRVYVEGTGRVDEVEVARSAGHADLDRAALEAVRRWRFEPLRDPSGLWVLVPVEFHLR
jgi:protein TonB